MEREGSWRLGARIDILAVACCADSVHIEAYDDSSVREQLFSEYWNIVIRAEDGSGVRSSSG